MKNNLKNIISLWIKDRNSFEKETVIVTNRWDFNTWVDMTFKLNDVAYISISATPVCARVIIKDKDETSPLSFFFRQSVES